MTICLRRMICRRFFFGGKQVSEAMKKYLEGDTA